MRRLLPALAAALAVVVVPAASAAQLRLSTPDTSRYPEVSVTAVTAKPTETAPALKENGVPATGLRAENLGRAKSVVLAVDTSRSMTGGALPNAIAGARSFVASKARSDRVAVVRFGERAVQLTGFSSATIDADGALRSLDLDAQQGTALHDAVQIAADALAAEPFQGRVLIVLTDGADVSSVASFEQAVAAARSAGVAVYAIGIESAQFAPEPLQRLAASTGGSYRGVASASALGAVYKGISAELERTWLLTYVTAARPGDAIRLTAGGAAAETVAPGTPAGSAPRGPAGFMPASAFGPVGSLAFGLVSGLLLLAAISVGRRGRGTSWVVKRLEPHVEQRRRAPTAQRERIAAGNAVMSATEAAFGHLKVWARLTRLIERADLPLRTVELVYAMVGSAFALALLGAVVGLSPLFMFLALAVGGAAPVAYVAFKARRRLKAFEDQLPDILLTLAAALKAGQSFKQGLQTVVNEGAPPASKEFQRVLAETRLGRPMDDALNEMAERVGSTNLEFVVTSVTIQSQVGGSLAGLFDMVADAVRDRQQFARKIKGLTSMGRASAYVLVGLPFFIAGVITLMNGEYMKPLWETQTGHIMIVGTLTMIGFGSVLLRKIVSFKG